LTFSGGQPHTPEILCLKELNGDLWAEVLVTTPLDRKAIRRWVGAMEELKIQLKAEGYTRILAGCGTPQSEKWAHKLFGFEKIKEVTLDDQKWSIVALCF
jgi:hypothetical protein